MRVAASAGPVATVASAHERAVEGVRQEEGCALFSTLGTREGVVKASIV